MYEYTWYKYKALKNIKYEVQTVLQLYAAASE